MTAAGAGLFIGRDGALAELEQAWASVVRGHPRLVLVSGDAGIGKSTLVSRFLDGRTDALVLRGGCFGLVSAELPYGPVIQALRPLLDVAEAAPLCAALTGAGEPAGEATRWAQSRLFETTLRLLGGLSRERPVVLALEDVHWADRATLDLLLFLLGNVVTERVLVLLTARCDEPSDPDWLTDALHRLTSGRSADVLELPPLADADAARLARELGVADDDAARLADRAGGNPLFLTELARGGGAAGLPRRLRDLLLVRLRHVSPAARRVVEVLSAATTPLSPRLLVRALGDDVGDPRAAVAEAFEAHLLAPGGDLLRPGHALLGEAVYAGLPPTERAWLHERIATAVEAEPGLGDAAWALAAYHWERADRPDRLPVPLARAAQAAARCYAFADAARAWQRLLDLDDATPGALEAAGLDRPEVLVAQAGALRWTEDASQGPGRLAEALGLLGGDATRGALAAERLALSLVDLGRTDEAVDAAEEAGRLAVSGPAAVRSRVETTYAGVLMIRGQYRESLRRCRAALAQFAGDTRERTRVLTVLAVDLVNQGDVAGALDVVAEAERLGHDLTDPEVVMRRYVNHTYVLESVGRYEQAVRTAEAGLAYAGRHALHVVAGPQLLANKASAQIAMGDLVGARATLHRATEDPGRRSSAMYAGVRLVEVDAALGELEEAEQRLEQLVQDARDLSVESVVQTQFRVSRAAVALARGRPGDALAEALAEFDRPDGATEPVVGLHLAALGLRALARTAAAPEADPVTTAAHLVKAAGTLFDQAPLPPCQLLHDLCIAEYREVLGSPDPDAWAELARRLREGGRDRLTAYVLYREAAARLSVQSRAAATPALQAAWGAVAGSERQLQEDIAALAATCRLDLSAPSAPPVAAEPARRPFGLTPREGEVLELVCTGATNRQIARDLGLSERTAAVHVSHILAKLSARNRAEAIATAHRTGAVRVPS